MEEPEINLIPFIDVLLVILIFLMLSTTYSKLHRAADQRCRRPRPRSCASGPREVVVAVASRRPLRRSTARPSTGAASRCSRPNWRQPRSGRPETVVIISADAMAAHQSGGQRARRRAPGRPARGSPSPAQGSAGLSEQRPASCVERHRSLKRLAARHWWRASLAATWLPLACTLLPSMSAALPRATFALRRAGYAHGLFATQQLPVPVLVVGNLVVGGAGKTPVGDRAGRALLRACRGYTAGRGLARPRPGVCTASPAAGRGRHIRAAQSGDEPLLHAPAAPPCRCVVGRDRPRRRTRPAACRHTRPVDLVILSDDGLQHTARCARDVRAGGVRRARRRQRLVAARRPLARADAHASCPAAQAGAVHRR